MLMNPLYINQFFSNLMNNDKIRALVNEEINKFSENNQKFKCSSDNSNYRNPNTNIFSNNPSQSDIIHKNLFMNKTLKSTLSSDHSPLFQKKELNSAFTPVSTNKMNANFNSLIFKNDKQILKSAKIEDSKQGLEMQSLRKRSLEEIDIPNFLSDDDCYEGDFFKFGEVDLKHTKV